MAKVLKEKIVSIAKIAALIYKMTIKSGYICESAMPGQFVNVKCSEGLNALLRRPISICSVDRVNKTFDIVFQIKGIGTEYLAKKAIGSEVDLIAPLGKPFCTSKEYKNIAVVGGGIGIFPLLNLLREMPQSQKSAFIGFRNKDYVVMTKEFKEFSDYLYMSTDDGSTGYKGLITDLLEKDLLENHYDIIYTCGPTPMIKKVVAIATAKNIKCQVSMEQRMGLSLIHISEPTRPY